MENGEIQQYNTKRNPAGFRLHTALRMLIYEDITNPARKVRMKN